MSSSLSSSPSSLVQCGSSLVTFKDCSFVYFIKILTLPLLILCVVILYYISYSIPTGHADQLSSENLAKSVCDALINVSKQRLLNVQRKFSSLDTDHSGRITTEELSQVLLNNQIFILGRTLTALVKKFEGDRGGVLHAPLARYLLGKYVLTLPAQCSGSSKSLPA